MLKQIKTSRPKIKQTEELPTFEKVEKKFLADRNKNRDANKKLKDWFSILNR